MYTPVNFINGSSVVNAAWLNGVDEMVYNVLGGWQGQTVATVLNALGIPGLSTPVPISEGGTGQQSAGAALAALGGTTLVAAEAAIMPYPGQTVAELAAGIAPVNVRFPEGNILRYGASTAAADNSAAINAALDVSSAGGNAAYIPGGIWAITSSLIAPAGSSMYGAGATNSVILVANGIDGLRLTAVDTTYGGRSFKDFKLLGILSGTTNNAHGVYLNSGGTGTGPWLLNLLFSNVAVINFNWGFYLTGVEDSTIFSCLVQNCWNGIFFNDQSANVFLLDNTINLVSPGTLITGTGSSLGIAVQGAPEVEGLHIQGGTIYGYDYDINLGLIFECQINAVDISNARICPIYFTSVVGPLVIRDCWIELGAGAAGVWNGGNANQIPGNLTGIFGTAVTPSAFSQVVIENNYIIADSTIAGSTGIYVGDNTNGISVRGNHIKNFDLGISGGDTLVNTGWALTGGSFLNNQIDANTTAIAMNGLSFNTKVGPNYIVNGTPIVITGTWPSTVVYEAPNTPMSGSAVFAAAVSVAVAFAVAMPSALYQITLTASATSASPPWYTSKAVGGFTINFSAAFTGTVDWSIKLS